MQPEVDLGIDLGSVRVWHQFWIVPDLEAVVLRNALILLIPLTYIEKLAWIGRVKVVQQSSLCSIRDRGQTWTWIAVSPVCGSETISRGKPIFCALMDESASGSQQVCSLQMLKKDIITLLKLL